MNFKLDDKLVKIMGIAAGGLVILILFIALISGCTKTEKYTLENINELEVKLMELAKNYYESNGGSLPAEGNSTTLSIQALVDRKDIKPLSEIIEGDINCSGQIGVVNNNGNILYLPKIDCGSSYKTKNLVDILLTDNSIVSTGNGLYPTSSGYIYRGESVNNHIAFAGRIWVILRINEDGTIKIMEKTKRESTVWDDRYNSEKKYNSGINDFINNNINSRLKDRLDEIYNTETEFDNNAKAHMLKQELCIGKRAEDETINDGSIECAQTLPNQMIGLIAVYEFIQASLDSECTSTLSQSCVNYNYLSKVFPAYWSITADKNTTNKAYKISDNMNLTNATNLTSLKVTALLSSEVLYSKGDGTEENPYVLVTSPYTPPKK